MNMNALTRKVDQLARAYRSQGEDTPEIVTFWGVDAETTEEIRAELCRILSEDERARFLIFWEGIAGKLAVRTSDPSQVSLHELTLPQLDELLHWSTLIEGRGAHLAYHFDLHHYRTGPAIKTEWGTVRLDDKE